MVTADALGGDYVAVVIREMSRVVREAPDRPAIESPDMTLTYGEVWAAAGAVAAVLGEAGIGPGDRVGVLGHRSANYVVGCLGCMQAGAAFVMLDAEWPADRLADIAGKLELAMLLHTPDSTPPPVSVPVHGLDLAARVPAVPAVPVAPRAPLYYVVTSGSTGEPKPVANHDAGFANFLAWMVDTYGYGPDTRGGWTTRPGFDASLFEIWPVLTNGGVLVIPPNELLLEPDRLIRWVADRELTVFVVPTPLAELCLAEEWPADLALRYLLCGGDALRRRPRPGLPFRMFDHYGPSECTTTATSAEVLPGDEPRQHANIGRPIRNVTIKLLDDSGAPVAPGSIGEIVIGGAAVGLGYWHDDDRTAAKFIADPDGPAGARMYRSGDLGRQLPDGTIEFRGRLDQQVKIHGHRIELGEIEHVLMAQAGIDLCAVVVGDPPASTLVAFASPASAAATGWREALGRVLPAYMVPGDLVARDQLPLTANGKVDRRRLAAELQPPPVEEEVRGLPDDATPRERQVAEVWQEILGHAFAGLDDVFFAVGGNSLLAAMAAARMRAQLAPRFGIREFLAEPTIRAQAALLEQLSDAGAEPPVEWREGDYEVIPATEGQQHMWLLSQMDQGLGAANIVLRIDILEGGNPDLFGEALQRFAARHVLFQRTMQVRNRVVCFLPAPRQVPFPAPIDLASEAHVFDAIKVLSRRVWAPATPLWRAQLYRLPEGRCVLAIILHHAVGDGWSAGIMMRELAAIYEALAAGREPDLPPPDGTFGAYSDWLARWLKSPAAARELAYWQGRLGRGPWHLPLRRERPRPPQVRFAGRRLPIHFSAAEWAAVCQLAEETETTVFAVLLGAMGVVLWQESGQARFHIGTPMANRVIPEAESVVGLVMNSVAVSFDFSGTPTFRELVEDLRDQLREAQANQTYPFEHLVGTLRIPHDPSRHPVFQHMLIFQNAHVAQAVSGDLGFREDELGNDTSRLDLTFCLWAEERGAAGWLEYSTDIFSNVDAQVLATAFHSVLTAGTKAPGRTPTGVPAGCVPPWPAAIAAQALARPTATAVVDGDRSLTYRELRHATGVLAAELRAGLAPGQRVGILAGNGIDFVVAALAVARAGTAYVPMDPENPGSRQDAVIDDATVATVLVATPKETPDWTCPVPTRRVDVDALLAAPRVDLPEPVWVPFEEEAYILFTSGSTGRPKGVVISHGNLNHLIGWQTGSYHMGPADRVSQLARTSFDTSVSEIWPALATGGQVHIAPRGLKLDPDGLIEWLYASRITFCDMTTPLAELCLPRPWPADCALRILKTGGDRLRLRPPPGLPFTFYNEYGPTECTVISTVGVVEPGDDGSPAPSIGVAIEGAVIHLLDDEGKPVPRGKPGELCIAGDGVAIGYVKRPDLTAERFVTRRIDNQSVRVYRSGDRASRLPNGEIEFLGRVDDQVQIRGFRVEPGEIEARLTAHPGVVLACVTPDERGAITQLVGWWTGEEMPAVKLRDFVATTLPDYMVPASFVHLAEMPLTPNGKIDRKKLMAQLAAGEVQEQTTVLAPEDRPSGPLENTLADVWCDLLQTTAVGRHDRFFDRGGHSILAIQMMEALRQRGLVLTLETLFQNATLAELAASLTMTADEDDDADPCIVPLNHGGSPRPPVFFIHSLPGDIIGYGDIVQAMGNDQTCYGIQSLGLSDPEHLHRTIPEMADFYTEHVIMTCPEGPVALCGWCYGGFIAVEMARRLRDRGREVALLALIEVPAPPPHLWFLPYYLELGWNVIRLGPKAVRERFLSMIEVEREWQDAAAVLGEHAATGSQDQVAAYIRNREPVYEANRRAGELHHGRHYPGRIDLFCGEERSSWMFFGDHLGWGTLAKDVKIHLLPGDHRSVLHGPAAAAIAARMIKLLDAAGQSAS